MSKVLYSEGDIFETLQSLESKTLLPHVCNNQLAWGAGFVVPLGRVYPSAREAYMQWGKGSPAPSPDKWWTYHAFGMGQSQFVPQDDGQVVVANMVAQTLGGARPLRYDKLVACMLQVAEYAEAKGIERIDCPLFGAGLAGGAWPFIHKLIQDCWISNDIGVMVHYMPDKSPPGFMEWFSANYVGEIDGAVEVQP